MAREITEWEVQAKIDKKRKELWIVVKYENCNKDYFLKVSLSNSDIPLFIKDKDA